MASGTLGDSSDDLNWRGRSRWTKNSIVYTRKTHKKAPKSCHNNESDPNNASTITEKPISSAPSTSTNQAPTHADVASATPTAAADVSSTSTSEDPNGFTGATEVNHAVEKSQEAVATKELELGERSPGEELSPTHGSPDKIIDSSCQQPTPEELQNAPSVAEDGCRTHDGVEEGSGSQTAELPNNDDSRLSYSNEAEGSEKTSHLDGKDELLQAGEVSPRNRRVSSPGSSENDLPNGTEVSAAQKLPIGNKAQNDAVMPISPQVSQGNGPVDVNAVAKPLVILATGGEVSTAQMPLGNEAQDDAVMPGSPQVSQGNGPVDVDGVANPLVISASCEATGGEVSISQLPIVNEEQNDAIMTGSPQVSQGNGPISVNGVVKPLVISSIDDRIRFNLCKTTSKNEIKELRKNLEGEIDQVRKLVKQLESKELQLASYNAQINNNNLSNCSNYIGAEGANIGGYSHPQPQHGRSNVVDRRLLLRVNPDVGAMGHQEMRPMGLARVNSDMGTTRSLEPRPYSRQLSVAVMENNNRAGEFVEKEKRTPKANQYYRNSEFLLGKDRLPPESNKRLKTSNGRKHSGETEHALGFGFGYDKSKNQVFKNCSSLLQRLMKHKHGWVFNEPVNAKALGLVDYHDIIKHPMDLGTIKTRLSQNWYKSPREFAEDVRLVFHNAMTYNPKGQDVHIMAEQLLQIFEERWAIIETEHNSYWRYQMYQEMGLPTSRKGPPQPHFAPAPVPVSAPTAAASIPLYAPAAPQMRPEPMTSSMAVDRIHRPHVGRTPVPKKPKAKDPNKRDMTYEEKQRLSTNLQGLPSEKLDAIVQIIKKRNTSLSQHDDEIEVDIDSVDPETLWELDRFVTNYKKSLSKNKRKAELALQARTLANQNAALTNSAPQVAVQMESGTAFEKRTALADGEKRGYNGSRPSSSSSSSSDSGSSSSDSDSDSSSGDGSDAGHSPKT